MTPKTKALLTGVLLVSYRVGRSQVGVFSYALSSFTLFVNLCCFSFQFGIILVQFYSLG